MKCEFLCLKCYLGPRNGILLQLFKVLCVCNTRVGQIRAGQIRVGQIRAHHCCEYTIADQPSIVLAAKVSFCPKYPRSSALDQKHDLRVENYIFGAGGHLAVFVFSNYYTHYNDGP